jgi:hypothetical protein
LAAARHTASGARLGNAEWSFSESWATTLTAFAALLGTTLAADLFPEVSVSGSDETEPFPTGSFTMLNLFFGAVVLLAPLVYAATKERHKQGIYVGVVWGLLVACVLTLWGVLGQLGTLMLMVVPELEKQEVFGESALIVVQLTLLGGAVCIMIYAVRNILWKLQDDVVAVKPSDGHYGVTEAAENEVEFRLLGKPEADGSIRSWSLL